MNALEIYSPTYILTDVLWSFLTFQGRESSMSSTAPSKKVSSFIGINPYETVYRLSQVDSEQRLDNQKPASENELIEMQKKISDFKK